MADQYLECRRMCGAMVRDADGRTFLCTLDSGHAGLHVAMSKQDVVRVWLATESKPQRQP